jgi:DNA repair protein RadC
VCRERRLQSINLVKLRMVREKTVRYEQSISTMTDALNISRPLFKNSYREMVVVIGIDSRNRPNVIHTVSLGGPSQAAVSISCVFKPLLLSNASGFILVHNHPADGLVPSGADKELTARLKSIGQQLDISMIDHIILNSTADDSFSFKMHGLM